MLEQVLGGKADTGLAGTADHLDGDDRVATKFKEVVGQTDLRNLQHVLPDRGDLLFQRRTRRHVGFLHTVGIRLGQGLALQLAVGAQWHLFDEQQLRRHHVVRQCLAQRFTDRFAQDLLSIRRPLARHDVGNQGALDGQHHCLAHRVLFHQARLDLAQLDAQATDLHLVVDTSTVVDNAVSPLAGQVTGAVQALALAERAGDEALGGQRRAAVVTARQTNTAQVQLADHAHRHGLQFGVEDVGLQVGDRQANRHAVAAFLAAGPVSNVDRRFGWAIEVVQPGGRQLGQDLGLSIHRQCLAAADDPAQAGAAGDLFVEQEHLQHRRHKMQGGDLVGVDQLDQAPRVAVIAGAGHGQARAGHQRPEKLPDRDIEAERGFLQHRVARAEAVGLLHPAQAVGQGFMAIASALGLAGGTGGVDHVSQLLGVQGQRRGVHREIF
ncbi:hypothetical protein D3C77_346450 [compost metagenome]